MWEGELQRLLGLCTVFAVSVAQAYLPHRLTCHTVCLPSSACSPFSITQGLRPGCWPFKELQGVSGLRVWGTYI